MPLAGVLTFERKSNETHLNARSHETLEPGRGASRRHSRASAANPPTERRDAKLVSRNAQDYRKRAPAEAGLKWKTDHLGGWVCQHSFTSLGSENDENVACTPTARTTSGRIGFRVGIPTKRCRKSRRDGARLVDPSWGLEVANPPPRRANARRSCTSHLTVVRGSV